MYKIIILVLLNLLYANGYDLKLESGIIKVHTEVFGDSKIEPSTKVINSNIKIDNSLTSMRGDISISFLSLKSENESRDKSMYKLIDENSNDLITFNILKLVKIDDKYQIEGNLTLNGVTKAIKSSTSITESKEKLNFYGKFDILLTQFNMEPPSMLFFTVRDKIDITYNLKYKKEF